MVRIILCAVLFITLLVGCSSKKEEQERPVITAETQRRIDSLEAYNDSIAKDKELHYQFQGTHSHLNTTGKLSEHAHQDLPKKKRLAKRRSEVRPARKEAYRKSKERQQQRIREHMRKTGKLKDTTTAPKDSVVTE